MDERTKTLLVIKTMEKLSKAKNKSLKRYQKNCDDLRAELKIIEEIHKNASDAYGPRQ